MLNYTLKRFLHLIPTVFGVVTLVFFFIHLVPGDPIDILLGEKALAADREKLRMDLGLNLPLLIQYTTFLKSLISFDLGTSLLYKVPVVPLLADRIPETFFLAIISLLFSLCFSFFLGLWSAFYLGRWQDKFTLFYTSILFSMPTFWVGPLLMIFFGLWLEVLPIGGSDSWQSVILPAFTLSMGMTAMTSRLIRSSILEHNKEDYIRTALSKGLSQKRAFLFHAFKNALLPVITVFFLQAGVLLTGAILVETIFAWNGVGLLLVDALNQRDYPVVQGCILFISMVYMLMTFISDLLYAFVDPRIRLTTRRNI